MEFPVNKIPWRVSDCFWCWILNSKLSCLNDVIVEIQVFNFLDTMLLTHLFSQKPLAHRAVKLWARASAVTSLSSLLHTWQWSTCVYENCRDCLHSKLIPVVPCRLLQSKVGAIWRSCGSEYMHNRFVLIQIRGSLCQATKKIFKGQSLPCQPWWQQSFDRAL